MESPFASESSQETLPEAKRGRPKGVSIKRKTAAASKADKNGDQSKAAALAAAASNARSRRGKGSTHAQTDATPEPEVAANMESGGEAADGVENPEADGKVGGDAGAAAKLDMARKASTGDGSRLERSAAGSDDSNLNSVAHSEHQAQIDSQVESRQNGDLPTEEAIMLNGTRVFNPVSASSKAPHRLSKVTGTSLHGCFAFLLLSPTNLYASHNKVAQ